MCLPRRRAFHAYFVPLFSFSRTNHRRFVNDADAFQAITRSCKLFERYVVTLSESQLSDSQSV